MQRRRIGGAGFLVGSVGLCCANLTGGPAETAGAADVVRRALDLGMTLLSLSGAAVADELLVGRALEGRRDGVVLATGVGLVRQADGRTVRRADADQVRVSVEHSLRRLRTDRVEVLVLEAVDPQIPVEETWTAMAALVATGAVGSLGVATSDPALAGRLQSVYPVTAVLAPASLAALPRGLVPWCSDRGVGLLATSPLAGGELARRERGAADGSGSLRAALSEVAARHRAATATVALAALLATGPTVVPLPATTRVEQLDEWAAASELSLDGDDLGMLAAAAHG